MLRGLLLGVNGKHMMSLREPALFALRWVQTPWVNILKAFGGSFVERK